MLLYNSGVARHIPKCKGIDRSVSELTSGRRGALPVTCMCSTRITVRTLAAHLKENDCHLLTPQVVARRRQRDIQDVINSDINERPTRGKHGPRLAKGSGLVVPTAFETSRRRH